MRHRILFYCHNVEGLGHIVRTLRLAAATRRLSDSAVTVITGCRYLKRVISTARMPPDVNIVQLPWLERLRDGSYQGEAASLEELKVIRAERVCTFAAEWRPNAFVVDHNPAGLWGELWPTLRRARRERWDTRFVWGVRDVWDAPHKLTRLYERAQHLQLSECLSHYSAAIAYTDSSWIDPLALYRPVLALPARQSAVGFVTAGPSRHARRLSSKPVIAVATGGGRRGGKVVGIVLDELGDLARHGQVAIRIAVGPAGIERALLERVSAAGDGVWVVSDRPVEKVIEGASVTITTAGYNTAYAVIQQESANIFVPCVDDSEEQLFRAQRLSLLPGVAVVDAMRRRLRGELRNVCSRLLGGVGRRELPFSLDGATRGAEIIVAIAGGGGRGAFTS